MVVSLYIDELKYRALYVVYGTIVCFVLSYEYAVECFYLIAVPYCSLKGDGFFLLISVFEVLFGYIKIGLIVSFFYFIFLGLLNFWLFLIPTIYNYYYGQWVKYISIGLVLSISYFLIIYKYILEFIYLYIIKLSDIGIMEGYTLDIEPRMLNYIDLTVKLILIFYFILQLPVIYFLISKYFLGDSLEVLHYRVWLYLMLLMLIISILPPDMVLHSIVFLIISLLLEFFILAGLLVNKYKIKLSS